MNTDKHRLALDSDSQTGCLRFSLSPTLQRSNALPPSLMLAWTIYISFLGVAVLMLLPKGNGALARKIALITAVLGFLVALGGTMQFKGGSEIETVVKLPWVPAL